MPKTNSIFCLLLLSALLFTGCANPENSPEENSPYIESDEFLYVEIADEATALADSPSAQPQIRTAKASGTAVKKNSKAVIDYSNAKDGYVMVQYTAETDVRLKAQVKSGDITYTYNLTAGEWAVLPFSEGDGEYTVTLYANVSGTKYAGVISAKLTVEMENEYSPFLYPNQYVDYSAAPNTIAKAAELTEGKTKLLDKVEVIYDYVVDTLTYDKEKAASVKSGYLPVLDEVLEEKKGICFDYAALMTGMLRSQDIPCKLVVGYAGKAYHAWISVWSEDSGWIDGVIYFDGAAWQRMDPTFASSSDRSSSIMKYIGDGENYSAKYLY